MLPGGYSLSFDRLQYSLYLQCEFLYKSLPFVIRAGVRAVVSRVLSLCTGG